MEAFARGRLQVQDESSMLVGAVSGIKPGQEVLDVCAAPGNAFRQVRPFIVCCRQKVRTNESLHRCMNTPIEKSRQSTCD